MKLAIIYHVYKNSASLRKSLESIFAQTDQNFEFVFVNDYASSKVNQIIKEISFSKLKNFTYITHSQNLGHSYSFNNAVKAISSEYVLYAGSNFIFDKNFIKIFNKIITHNPNTDVISFNVKNNDASFSTFNKLNVKMKQTIQSSMKDKIVATKMIRNFNLGLNENFYSPLVFIYQILFLFKK
jgi:glycosyltransferase involved in cell wall biosynthesis